MEGLTMEDRDLFGELRDILEDSLSAGDFKEWYSAFCVDLGQLDRGELLYLICILGGAA
jgi:hypothetical protein